MTPLYRIGFTINLGLVFQIQKTIYGKKIKKLRYGENPHQNASIYISKDDFGFKKIKGKKLKL